MSRFGSKEDILRVIETQFSQMQTSRLSMEDLETLVDHARELYERTLILRYKAYEEKVFGEAKEVLEQPEATLSGGVDEAVFEETEAPQAEWLDDAPAVEEPRSESDEAESEPVFDFSLFDEAEEKEMPVFQLHTEPEAVSGNAISEASENSNTEDSVLAESEPEQQLEEHPIDSMEEETPMFTEPEPIQPIEQEKEAAQNQEEDLFKNILQTDDSLASRFMLSKLDTLVGSFGFNEKFQCVQELFGGSGDDFNQAIEVLDNQHNFEEAKKQLLFYVHLNKWNLQSEVAIEFIRKVERRYN